MGTGLPTRSITKYSFVSDCLIAESSAATWEPENSAVLPAVGGMTCAVTGLALVLAVGALDLEAMAFGK